MWLGVFLPIGFGAWVPLAAGYRARHRPWILSGIGLLALAIFAFAYSTYETNESTNVGGGLLMLAWMLSGAASFALRRPYARRMALRSGYDDRIALAEHVDAERREMIELAVADPRRAVGLGVGRPDLPGSRHGHLVDVNHAPAHVLTGLPGVSDELGGRDRRAARGARMLRLDRGPRRADDAAPARRRGDAQPRGRVARLRYRGTRLSQRPRQPFAGRLDLLDGARCGDRLDVEDPLVEGVQRVGGDDGVAGDAGLAGADGDLACHPALQRLRIQPRLPDDDRASGAHAHVEAELVEHEPRARDELGVVARPQRSGEPTARGRHRHPARIAPQVIRRNRPRRPRLAEHDQRRAAQPAGVLDRLRGLRATVERARRARRDDHDLGARRGGRRDVLPGLQRAARVLDDRRRAALDHHEAVSRLAAERR